MTPDGKSRPALFASGLAGTMAIAAAAAFAFAPAIRGTWLWDDSAAIPDNPVQRQAGGLWKIWSGRAGQDYFPLTTSVQWLQWHLWQGQVEGYHLTNIGLHVLNALLLWVILRRFGVRAAWFGGLLFAVHPLVVESVAWISELKNVLSLLFLLLAFLAYARWEAGGGRREDRPPLLYLSSFVLFAAAMLSKATVVMFPAVLLLHAWWRRGRLGWKDLGATAPFFAVSLVFGVVTIHFQFSRAMAHFPPLAEGVGTRIAAAGPAVIFYLLKVLLPIHLLPIYPRWVFPGPVEVMAWGAIIGSLALLWAHRDSWGRHALFGVGFFLLNLAPVLGIVPMAFLRISRVSDHFAYLSLPGLIALAAAAAGLWRARVRPAAFGIGAAIVAVACAGASRRQARAYASEEALWTFTLRHNPQAWLAQNNLGILRAKAGRLDEAIACGEEAVRLRPDFAEVRNNLGLTLTEAHRLPEAIFQLQTAARLRPDLAGAHLNLGRALLAAGRGSESVAEFETACRLEPGNAEARRDLAVAHNNTANALARAGNFPAAVEEFQAALRIAPENAGVRRNLGYALQSMGRMQEASREFEEANRLDPRR